MLTQRLRRLVTTLAARALSAGSGLRLLDATVPSGGVRVARDVPYGAGPRRALDIYQPSGPGQDRPLVMFFYGGSWKTGARGEYRFVATALERRGMVVAMPDYRLYPETVFPGFLEDAAGAVAWAAENAARHGAAPVPDRPLCRRLYRGDAGAEPGLSPRGRHGPHAARGRGRHRQAS